MRSSQDWDAYSFQLPATKHQQPAVQLLAFRLLAYTLTVVALPALSALISLTCALAIGRDALRQPKPDRIAWFVAFLMFAVAAGTEVIGSTAGWNATLARLYYLTGAVLVVGFLALGQLYLLAADRIRRVAPGIALLITAISASTVWGVEIDQTRLEADGWDAIARSTGLSLLAIGINTVGTLILVGGLVYSAVRFRQRGVMRNRMVGCLLIAAGALTVAMGGTLTRFGSEQYLYIAMSAGVAVIFAGYLWTKRPEEASRREGTEARSQTRRRGLLPQTRAAELRDGLVGSTSPGIAFIADRLMSLSDDELSRECAIWSVSPRAIECFSRAEARRVWSFRTRLTPNGQHAFDARPPGIRLQLTELYFDVMSADITTMELTPVASIERASGHD